MATVQRFQFDRFRRYEAIARNFRSGLRCRIHETLGSAGVTHLAIV